MHRVIEYSKFLLHNARLSRAYIKYRMKLEISDTTMIVLFVLLCLVILGLLVLVVYYKVERRTREKLKREIEDARKLRSGEMVRKLEKAGMKERHLSSASVGKLTIGKQTKHNQYTITLEHTPIKGSKVSNPAVLVTTTSRLRVLNGEEVVLEHHNTDRLHLEDSVKDLRTGFKAPVIEEKLETEHTVSKYADDQGKPLSTLDDIKNFKLDEDGLDIEVLDNSGRRSPKVSFTNIRSSIS